MQTPLLPPLKTYTLVASTRKRFQTILNDQNTDNTELPLLTPHEKQELQNIITDYLEVLNGKQAFLLNKLAQLSGVTGNDQLHENNSRKVACAVQQHIVKHNAMPNYLQIAQQTGLNRKTVAKHITEHINNPHETTAQYSYAAKGLMDMILSDATKHRNLNAARIYLNALNQMTTKAAPPAQVIINETVVTQLQIDNLTNRQKQVILIALNPNAKIITTPAQTQPTAPQSKE